MNFDLRLPSEYVEVLQQQDNKGGRNRFAEIHWKRLLTRMAPFVIGRIGRLEAWATSRDSRAASVDVVFIENAARWRIDFDELASCIETVGPDVNTGRAASPRRF